MCYMIKCRNPKLNQNRFGEKFSFLEGTAPLPLHMLAILHKKCFCSDLAYPLPALTNMKKEINPGKRGFKSFKATFQ